MSQSTAASSQYLSFFLAGQKYALGILQAKEIIEYDTVTTVRSVIPTVYTPARPEQTRPGGSAARPGA
ncbi:MAG TPA: hypothetical protein VF815_37390 [Myxococcaceae bacterium]|jgi:chemotaxis signal transduction protein